MPTTSSNQTLPKSLVLAKIFFSSFFFQGFWGGGGESDQTEHRNTYHDTQFLRALLHTPSIQSQQPNASRNTHNAI